MISNSKLSPLVRVLPEEVKSIFKDTYVLEFLNLPDSYPENDLQKALIAHMKQFILELGRDFLFVGEEYRVQVATLYAHFLFQKTKV